MYHGHRLRLQTVAAFETLRKIEADTHRRWDGLDSLKSLTGRIIRFVVLG